MTKREPGLNPLGYVCLRARLEAGARRSVLAPDISAVAHLELDGLRRS
jgi:hypothetical protein